jgi:hypothetical protein
MLHVINANFSKLSASGERNRCRDSRQYSAEIMVRFNVQPRSPSRHRFFLFLSFFSDQRLKTTAAACPLSTALTRSLSTLDAFPRVFIYDAQHVYKYKRHDQNEMSTGAQLWCCVGVVYVYGVCELRAGIAASLPGLT